MEFEYLVRGAVAKTEARVAVVTGGTRGMGRVMVQALLEKGLVVAAVAKQEGGAEELTRAVGDHAGKLYVIAMDLTAEGAADRIVSEVLGKYGRLDVLVNNAGIGSATIRKDSWQNPVPFWKVSGQQWRDFFAINTNVQFDLARAAVPAMIDRKWGRIINVTTSLYSMISSGRMPYGPSKAAMEAAAAVMAADLAGTGVTANVLTPGGPVNTEFVPPEAGLDRERMIQPSVMAAPLKWLVSEEANGFTARRIVAAQWAVEKGAERCSSPIAWLGLGNDVIEPAPYPASA
jgi:NAD(P)-dependent dehydrogenase (short-subunit alcohol dehydrogenase family)